MNDKKDFQELLDVLNKCDSKLRQEFLKDLLTANELRQVCQRWRLIKMLGEGMPQRAIAKTLKTSLCKITRGSKEMKKKNSSFRQVLKIRRLLK